MGRWFWGVCLALWVLLGAARGARAGDFTEIHVCVRPPNVPAGVAAWAYTPGTASVILNREQFKKQAHGLTAYVFDPAAPEANNKLLPIPYNTLPCPERVLPVKPIEAPPPPDPKKSAAPKPSGDKPADAEKEKAEKEKAKKAKDGEEEPPDLPKPIVYPQSPPRPQPEQHLPSNGVTTHWPNTVLPVVKRSETGAVLPTTTVLPIVSPGHGALATNKEGDGARKEGSGEGKGGVAKTPFEKFAEEMAYAGAIGNQQFNEDTKRPDGKRYGIPGGKNVNGPNNPVAQATAGAVLVTAAVISAAGFDKKMLEALKKKVPLLIRGSGKVAEEAAEKLVEATIAKQGEKARLFLADALNKNGAIGEYSVMAKFTDKLGGRVQAHHIIEQQFAKLFKLGNPDRIPAVLLTEAEHKAMTAALRVETAGVKDAQALWKAYQRAYKDHPAWLAAIKSYFEK